VRRFFSGVSANEGGSQMHTPAGATAGTWVGVAVLLLVLVLVLVLGLAVHFLVVGWRSFGDDMSITVAGYFAMSLGTVVTLALGIGLMTLVFYSNRKG
jgi:hypothetical protein